MNYHLPEKKQADLKMQEYQLSLIAEKWQQKYTELSLKSFSDCFPSEENKTLSQLLKTSIEINNQTIKLSVPSKYLLFNVIKSFASSFNLTNNFRDDQIQEFVNDIFEFYQHLTIRDVKFFLHKVKAGNFGQIYNRLDGPLLFGYLKVYSDLRVGEAERFEENLRKAKDIVTTYEPNSMYSRISDLFKTTQKQIAENKPREKSQAEINLEQTFLKISKDFNDLHRSQGSQAGVMFVKYKGKMLNFEEYYNEVINETF